MNIKKKRIVLLVLFLCCLNLTSFGVAGQDQDVAIKKLIEKHYASQKFPPLKTAIEKIEYDGDSATAVVQVTFVKKLEFQKDDGNWILKNTQKPKSIDKDVVSWKDADRYYGKIKTVEGKIVDTHNSGKACFLNFHSNWKVDFTAVIFSSDFYKFPSNPEDYYYGKKVRVKGLIKEYQGKPEIILKSPSQIEVIE